LKGHGRNVPAIPKGAMADLGRKRFPSNPLKKKKKNQNGEEERRDAAEPGNRTELGEPNMGRLKANIQSHFPALS